MKKTAFLVSADDRSAEHAAGLNFAQGRGASLLKFSDLPDRRTLLRRFSVIWWHYDASLLIPPDVGAENCIALLRSYVEEGGSLLLTLLASQYVCDLGIESSRPNRVEKGAWREHCWARGHPDIRGLAGFRGHPVFEGMHGAAYTWNPTEGRPYSAAIYDGASSPAGGKVVAVERQYIRLNEQRKIMTEYRLGRGRVLTIGTHCFFAERDNRFRLHLERLTTNCLAYLSGTHTAVRKTSWVLWGAKPRSEEHFTRPVSPSAGCRQPGESGLTIIRDHATENFFDVGGRRMLIMGEERKGVEEVWAHPVRILRGLRSCLVPEDGEPVWLDDLVPRITVRPESITREFDFVWGRLVETTFGDLSSPAGAICYRLHGIRRAELTITGSVDLRIMWPLSEHATGSLIYSWDRGLRALRVRNDQSTLVSYLGASANPLTTRISAETASVAFTLSYTVRRGTRGLAFCFAGSGEGLRDAERAYRKILRSPSSSLAGQTAHFRSLLQRSTIVSGPDPAFNEAYRWALAATDRFSTTTPGLGSSIMAGYGTTARGWDGGQERNGRPGYAWYFGRDSIWTALAMIGYGDHETVRSILEFLGRHQDLNGKIFHEVTTSGHVHYDAADATPLYILLMGRYLRASGDRTFVRREYEKMRKALAFCLSTDTESDHLIENTDVGHGWVEGGQLFPVHAELYLNACWAASLEEAAYTAGCLDKKRDAARWRREAATVREVIERRFWNEADRFYSFGLKRDGSFDRNKTALPAVHLYLHDVGRDRAEAVLEELGSDRFTTFWGTRIVGSDNPMYYPEGYHYGSIWPLYTGWTSLAAFARGKPALGFRLLECNMGLHRRFTAGCMPEVLHGERCEPVGVCTHQAWSESMVLQPVLEGMLGLTLNAARRILALRPFLPDGWDFVDFRGIRLGDQRIDMNLRRREGNIQCSLKLRRGHTVRVMLTSETGSTRRITLHPGIIVSTDIEV